MELCGIVSSKLVYLFWRATAPPNSSNQTNQTCLIRFQEMITYLSNYQFDSITLMGF